MDILKDKLAHKLTAQEMIKANTEADTKEMNQLKGQVAGYEECLTKLQKLIEVGTVKLAGAHVNGEEINRLVAKALQQDSEGLEQLQGRLTGQLDDMGKAMRQQLYSVDSSVKQQLDSVEKSMQEQLEILQERLDGMGRTMQQSGGVDQNQIQAVQEQFADMDRYMHEQYDSIDRAMKAQLDGMDKLMQDQLISLGRAMEEQLGSMDKSVKEQLLGVGRAVQDQLGIVDESVREQFDGVNRVMREQFESANQSTQAQFGSMLQSMQEQLDGVNQLMAGQFVNLDQSVKEQLNSRLGMMAETLEEKMAQLSEQSKSSEEEPLSESIHRECVKVYRNVQAVVVEESGKQGEALTETKAGLASLKGKAGFILGVSAAGMLFSLVGLVIQILSWLNIISF